MSASAGGATRPLGRLFWKFLLAFWLSLALAGAAVGSFVWLSTQHDGPPLVDRRPMGQMLVDAAATVATVGGTSALADLLARQSESEGRPRLAVLAVDATGRELLGRPVNAEALAAARDALLAPPSARTHAAVHEVRINGEPMLLFVPGPPGRPLHIGGPPLFGPRMPPWVLPLAIGFIASLLLSALLAWYFARPIRALGWAFDEAARGALDVRVAPRIGARRDEIADLGHQFDRMVQRLQDLIESQKRLFHDVSHELRSPLARMQVAVALARRDPAQASRMLDRIESETARMDALIGEVLTLARLSAGIDAAAESEPVDLADLLESVVEDARFEAGERGVSIALDARTQPIVRGQPTLLQRAIENVLRNAIQHAPAASTVDVTLEETPHAIAIRIADRGPGLSRTEIDAMFEPFVRGQGRRSGFGLGGAIAQRAVLAHGGGLSAAPRDGGGLVVTISLPAAASATREAPG